LLIDSTASHSLRLTVRTIQWISPLGDTVQQRRPANRESQPSCSTWT